MECLFKNNLIHNKIRKRKICICEESWILWIGEYPIKPYFCIPMLQNMSFVDPSLKSYFEKTKKEDKIKNMHPDLKYSVVKKWMWGLVMSTIVPQLLNWGWSMIRHSRYTTKHLENLIHHFKMELFHHNESELNFS